MQIQDYRGFFDQVLQRFGGGRGRLTLLITDVPIDAILKQADRVDALEDVQLPVTGSMFYIDNACSLETSQLCMVVMRRGAQKRYLVPCKPLDQDTIHNYLVQALQTFRSTAPTATAYLLSVNRVRVPQPGYYYDVAAVASVRDLVRSGSYPARDDPTHPNWLEFPPPPPAQAATPRPKPRSNTARNVAICLGTLAAIAALVIVIVCVYEATRRSS